jgi:hypothetical protein
MHHWVGVQGQPAALRLPPLPPPHRRSLGQELIYASGPAKLSASRTM